MVSSPRNHFLSLIKPRVGGGHLRDLQSKIIISMLFRVFYHLKKVVICLFRASHFTDILTPGSISRGVLESHGEIREYKDEKASAYFSFCRSKAIGLGRVVCSDPNLNKE